MNRLKYGVQVFLGCTLVYAAGCGGSTSPGDTGDTGSAGSKGSFAGATAASAGYSSTNTGGFNAGDPVDVGGSPSASDPGSTGVAGSETSVGGDTSSGGACPTTTPKSGDMCSNATGAGGASAGIGAAALDCPYPDGSTCRCTNRRWECTEPPPPACPKTQPTGACSAVQACTYGTAAMRIRCECDGKAWACDMAGGAAPRCTAKARAALATGDTCTGIGECPAAGATTKTCVCDGKTV